VPTALQDFAELVIVTLSRGRGAGGDYVPALDQELPHGTGVIPLRLETFDVTLSGRLEDFALWSAAVAILISEASCCEERPTVAAIPEHAWTCNGSPIAR
jgi:hypothetical protein